MARIALMAGVLCVCVFAPGQTPRSREGGVPADSVGLLEDCSTTLGWYELDANGKKIAPRVRMETTRGILQVHTNRGLLMHSKKFSWAADGVLRTSILRKDYGAVDLDKYHYLVVNVRKKGSAVFFGVNGFDTKAGYTTGVTAVDLRDYDHPGIHGRQNVRLEMDLHDNLTTLVLDEIKLVSELTASERKVLIGRGLTIRKESLSFEDFHGLHQLKLRSKTPPPHLDAEEMAIFRDSATGAISTRLTSAGGNSYLVEGGIWSADGSAIKFGSIGRGMTGQPVYLIGEGRIVAGPRGSRTLWNPTRARQLLAVTRRNKTFSIASWDRITRKTSPVAQFTTPQVGGYVEAKYFTSSGKLIVAFRETPHMFVIDPVARKVRYIKLSTRLKDASLSADEEYVGWARCYTYERLWWNLRTGEKGLGSSFSSGHGCSGAQGRVGSFGVNLKVFVPHGMRSNRTPGKRVKIWANWQNHVITDYGHLTSDNEWIFTNGTRGDVKNQHVMVPSNDTGAVLRVARYFTRFSWESPTYVRPSPDYTKIIYNDNCLGPTQLIMVYTRRTDAPSDVVLNGRQLTWRPGRRTKELLGYHVYRSTRSGRDFRRLTDRPITAREFRTPDASAYYTVTAVEHSGLESMFSPEATETRTRTYYFEAERQELLSPARRFYAGRRNDFQCVRINAESPTERNRAGGVTLNSRGVASGTYSVWLLTNGRGTWRLGAAAVKSPADKWAWVQIAKNLSVKAGTPIRITSSDDALKLDTVMLTTADFRPMTTDPRDHTAPPPVKGLAATMDRKDGTVKLTWRASDAPDLHHYSVYCGATRDFACDNGSIIRSVLKTSITDAGMDMSGELIYKVVSVDSRHNRSTPAVIIVPPPAR